AGLNAAEANFWKDRKNAARNLDRSYPLLAQLPATAQMPWGLPGDVSVVSAETRSANELPHSEDAPSWLSNVILPHGYIRDIHLSKRDGAPFIIHIQDAHDVEEAQRNVAAIVQGLNEERGVDLVGLEGASGAFALEPYRAYPDAEITRSLADYFLKEGYLSGPEFAGLTMRRPPVLWGVEDPALYQKNIGAVQSSFKLRPEAKRYVDRLETAVQALKGRVYSEELKEFDKHFNAYKSQKAGLGAYARYLMQVYSDRLAKEAIGRPSYTNLHLLRDALEWEEVLDFEKVESEREELVQTLAVELPQPALKELVRESLKVRSGRMGYGDYYKFLRRLCRNYGINLDAWGSLSSYIKYVLLAEQIDREGLLEELSRLETAVQDLLAVTLEQKRLVGVNRNVLVLGKLIEHAMTPEDFAYYRKNRLGLLDIGKELKGIDAALPYSVVSAPKPLSAESLRPFEEFCEYALKRNEVLVGNLLAKLPGTRGPVAILVAGGFHTAGLTDVLRGRDVSFAVVTPKIKEVPKDHRSLDVFARDPLPLEKLFAGETIFLAPERLLAENVFQNAQMSDRVQERFETLEGAFAFLFPGLKIARAEFEEELAGEALASLIRRTLEESARLAEKFKSVESLTLAYQKTLERRGFYFALDGAIQREGSKARWRVLASTKEKETAARHAYEKASGGESRMSGRVELAGGLVFLFYRHEEESRWRSLWKAFSGVVSGLTHPFVAPLTETAALAWALGAMADPTLSAWLVASALFALAHPDNYEGFSWDFWKVPARLWGRAAVRALGRFAGSAFSIHPLLFAPSLTEGLLRGVLYHLMFNAAAVGLERLRARFPDQRGLSAAAQLLRPLSVGKIGTGRPAIFVPVFRMTRSPIRTVQLRYVRPGDLRPEERIKAARSLRAWGQESVFMLDRIKVFLTLEKMDSAKDMQDPDDVRLLISPKGDAEAYAVVQSPMGRPPELKVLEVRPQNRRSNRLSGRTDSAFKGTGTGFLSAVIGELAEGNPDQPIRLFKVGDEMMLVFAKFLPGVRRNKEGDILLKPQQARDLMTNQRAYMEDVRRRYQALQAQMRKEAGTVLNVMGRVNQWFGEKRTAYDAEPGAWGKTAALLCGVGQGLTHPMAAPFTETVGLAWAVSLLDPTGLAWVMATLAFAAIHSDNYDLADLREKRAASEISPAQFRRLAAGRVAWRFAQRLAGGLVLTHPLMFSPALGEGMLRSFVYHALWNGTWWVKEWLFRKTGRGKSLFLPLSVLESPTLSRVSTPPLSKEHREKITDLQLVIQASNLSWPLVYSWHYIQNLEENFPNADIRIYADDPHLFQCLRFGPRVKLSDINQLPAEKTKRDENRLIIHAGKNPSVKDMRFDGQRLLLLDLARVKYFSAYPNLEPEESLPIYREGASDYSYRAKVLRTLGMEDVSLDGPPVLDSSGFTEPVLGKMAKLREILPRGKRIYFVNMMSGNGIWRHEKEEWRAILRQLLRDPNACVVINEGSQTWKRRAAHPNEPLPHDQILDFYNENKFAVDTGRLVRIGGGEGEENDLVRLLAMTALADVVVTEQSAVTHLADWMRKPMLSFSYSVFSNYRLVRENSIDLAEVQKGVVEAADWLLERKRGSLVPGALGLWKSLADSFSWFDLRTIGWVEGIGIGLVSLLMLAGLMPQGPPAAAADLVQVLVAAFSVACLYFPLALAHYLSGVLTVDPRTGKHVKTPFDWTLSFRAARTASTSFWGLPFMAAGIWASGWISAPLIVTGLIIGGLVHARRNARSDRTEDSRPVAAKLLHEVFVRHDVAVKNVVNPDDKPLTVLYGGAGADVTNVLLATNARKAYFIAKYGNLSADDLRLFFSNPQEYMK
ncbi:MAG: hypothetical protein HY548_03065, partial [Elusimicrobia bacterium]|nr:hypothetical protein [Elusimicrobiota bacterium]